MNRSQIEFYAHLTITLLGIGVVAFLFFRYLFVAILPFLIAWASAFILRPIIAFASKRTGIPKKLVSVVLTILCVCMGIGLTVLFGFFLIKEAWELFSSIAENEAVIRAISRLTAPLAAIFGGEGSNALSEHIGTAIREGIGRLVSVLVSLLSSIAASVPGVLFFILITVISSIYFALDIDRINSFVKGLLPEKASKALVGFKNSCLSIGAKYIRSYLIIMLITFAVMLAGLLIIGVENAVLIATVLSVLDLLPLIGVGTVIVPWSIFQFIVGNTGVGVGLVVLLVLNELIRQITEPKIIGKNLGVHPIVSLVLLYTAYSILGFAGLIVVPLVAVILNIIFDKKDASKV